MIKRIFMVAMMFCVMLAASAQEKATKPRMYVEKFIHSEGVDDAFTSLVREKIISALNDSERFNLVDATTEGSMQREEKIRETEKAMADEKTRSQIISAAGHDYILSGKVLKCAVAKGTKDGKTVYSCDVNYSISVTEVVTSTTAASKTFGHSSLNYETKEKAHSGTLTLVNSDIKEFLIDEFPIKGELIPMDYEIKKNKLTTCYIGIGSDIGVKKNDYFSVLFPTIRAGRAIYNKVGVVKVTEVVDGTLSFCKSAKDSKDLKTAIDAYMSLDEATRQKQPIKVQSCQAPFFSSLLDFD